MEKRVGLVGLCLVSGISSLFAQDYLPILQYHHVSESTPFSTTVSTEQFQSHMDYLKEAGFNVVPLAQSLADIRNGTALPEKSVAITFDDAYRNIYENGFPILKAYSFPFTVFINTQPIEQNHRSFLTWDQIREMTQSGGEFANHTVSHPYLLRMESGETKDAWWQRVTNEVETVEQALKAELGHSPKMLAYPYGESNAEIQDYLRQQDIIAFGQQSGVVSQHSDFTNLPRFPAAGHYAKLNSLKVKLNAKPMPLASVVNSGLYAGDAPVSMTMTFDQTGYRFKDLVCYVSGQEVAALDWQNQVHVTVTAQKPFRVGRSRINCTMPDRTGQHYYWFSNVWIKPKGDEGYVGEKFEK